MLQKKQLHDIIIINLLYQVNNSKLDWTELLIAYLASSGHNTNVESIIGDSSLIEQILWHSS